MVKRCGGNGRNLVSKKETYVLIVQLLQQNEYAEVPDNEPGEKLVFTSDPDAVGITTLDRIEKKNGARAAAYSIAHDLPGREHLGTLLEATARKYSSALAALAVPVMAQARGKWAGNIEKIFGYESRGVALIGARVTGGVDATLRKLSPSVERVQCRRALHPFHALKVLRTRCEGNAILYELDPEWSGYSPLCDFIDALVAASPRHQAWAKVVPLVQVLRRRKMAENAGRRRITA